jgi:hypothetical protein
MKMPFFKEPFETQDVMQSILSHAVAAPSPLNTQPWRVMLLGPCLLALYPDTERLLPAIDPTMRQMYLSCGAFIENLEIAARAAGFRAEISLFPSGWAGMSPTQDQPVAKVELTCNASVGSDPLFSWIHTRHTNRRIYTAREILPETFSALAGSFDQPFTSFGFSADSSFREELAGYLKTALEVELSLSDRLEERLSYIRINDTTGDKRRDGYGSIELGLYGITGWLSRIRTLITPYGSKNRYARKLLILLIEKQSESAAAFGWIVTKGNSRYDQIRAGRAYSRLHLTAASLGLSVQPMTSILEPYSGMEEVARKFRNLLGIPDTHMVQMVFRLGYSCPGALSQRRDVKDLYTVH